MSQIFPRFCLLAAAFCLLSAFTSQPIEERKAQDILPQSKDAQWKTLSKTKIKLDEKKGLYSATYPAEVKALAGKEMTITGFIFPLEPSEKFKHFLLSARTPTCQFCPPGEPNEVLDVWLDKPIAWKEDAVKVTGTFELMNNPELGVFFALKKAKAAF